MKTITFLFLAFIAIFSNTAYAQCYDTVYDCYPRQQPVYTQPSAYVPPPVQYDVHQMPVYELPVQQVPVYQPPVQQVHVGYGNSSSQYQQHQYQQSQQQTVSSCTDSACYDHPVPKQGRNTTPATPGYVFNYMTDCIAYPGKFYTWRINMCKSANSRWVNPGWGNYLPAHCPQNVTQVLNSSTTREEYRAQSSQNNWHYTHVAQ